MHKQTRAAIIVLAIIVIAVAWRNDKLNNYLPKWLRHKSGPFASGFTGLTRSGVYTMRPGGAQGMPGIDLNTSDWV